MKIKIIISLAFVLVISFFLIGQQNNTIKVDFTSEVKYEQTDVNGNLRPLIGFLHSQPDTALWDKYVKPLNPSFWRNKEFFQNYHSKLIQLDSLNHYQVTISGGYSANGKERAHKSWPFNDYKVWVDYRAEKISKLPISKNGNISVTIWNEPVHEKFWAGSHEQFFSMFCETVSWINSNRPDLLVGGADATGVEAMGFTLELLEFMRNWKKQFPDKPLRLDFLTIHGLGQTHEKFMSDLEFWHEQIHVKKEYVDLGITNLIYNEHLRRGKESEQLAWAIKFQEAFEKNGVRFASRACWGTCRNASLDGLLNVKEDGSFSPNQMWHGYKNLAQMTGKRYKIDHTMPELSVIAGSNNTTGEKTILVGNISKKPTQYNFQLTLDDFSSIEIFNITNRGNILLRRETSANFSVNLDGGKGLLISVQ